MKIFTNGAKHRGIKKPVCLLLTDLLNCHLSHMIFGIIQYITHKIRTKEGASNKSAECRAHQRAHNTVFCFFFAFYLSRSTGGQSLPELWPNAECENRNFHDLLWHNFWMLNNNEGMTLALSANNTSIDVVVVVVAACLLLAQCFSGEAARKSSIYERSVWGTVCSRSSSHSSVITFVRRFVQKWQKDRVVDGCKASPLANDDEHEFSNISLKWYEWHWQINNI